MVSKHIIKQQILDVSILNADDHEEITTALSKVYRENIEEILENSCDGLIPANKMVRIDSLTVDLGHLQLEQLGTTFPIAVKNAIRESLFRKIRDREISPVSSGKAAKKTKEEALLYYLKTGLLPWYYEGYLHQLRQEHATKRSIRTGALRTAIKNAESRKRAFDFFKEEVWFELLLQELPREKRIPIYQLKTLRHCLDKLATKTKVFDAKESQMIRVLMQSLKPEGEANRFVIEQLINQWVLVPTQKKVKRLPQLLPIEFRSRMQQLLRNIQWKEAKVLTKDETLLLETLTTPTKKASEQPTKMENVPQKNKVATKFDLDKKLELQGDLTIENAGLILAWPYLEAFFTGLGLMEDRSFTDKSASIKAVHLLHYLVFKDAEGDETSWLLNKLLCGLEPTAFITDTFDLEPSQKEECEHLLTAVITNWPALKNTSPDSLRQTFLQREGILAPYDHGWILKIERQPFDILLDRLTWAISVVKMPWNDYLITTEW